MITKQTICKEQECTRKVRYKGYRADGKKRYDSYCIVHRRGINKDMARFDEKISKANIKNEQCEQCGWDSAPCDRHRIDPKVGYIKRNVMILCPNCHRVETLKKKL